jgi:branched-subunit amino acid aminotransferase/4-amino-4-deoxychorismate lyase
MFCDSITRREVFSIAEQMGIKTRLVTAKPADLVGLEVWALSSLQGIRVASEWVDLGGPLGKPKHFESFERRLRLLSTAI